MLQQIRDHFTGVVAWIILGALALVFVAWGAYGMVDVGFGPTAYAAKVNGERVSQEEANRVWLEQQAQLQRFLGDQELPEAERVRIQDAVLERLINRSLITSRAAELGYRATDEQIHAAIQNEPAFQIEGKFSPQVAKGVLTQSGLTEAQYMADLRRTRPAEQLQGAIRVSDFLLPKELDRIVALEDEQREVRYAVYPVESFASAVSVDDAAVQAYYTERAANFMTTESVRLAFGELRADQVAAQSAVAEQDLRKQYDDNKDRYVEPEKRRASHILITESSDDVALAKANQVLAQIKAGKDFGALASEVSKDPGSASKGGDLGWADRTVFVGPFADAVFSMQSGELRGPVKTQYGYHIIRLDGIEPGKTRTFEEARPEIEAEVRRVLSVEAFAEREEALQSRLEQPNVDFDAVAKEFGLVVGEVADFARGSGGGALGDSRELQELVFSDVALNEQRVVGPVSLADDRVVVAKVLEHRKPQARPLAEVRDAIVAAIRQERGQIAARAAADADLQRVKGGSALETVAAARKPEGPKFIGRNDPSVPDAIRSAAFRAPRPDAKPWADVVELPQGAAVLQVIGSRADLQSLSAEERAARGRQILSRLGNADVAAYYAEARRSADVEKNPKAFQ